MARRVVAAEKREPPRPVAGAHVVTPTRTPPEQLLALQAAAGNRCTLAALDAGGRASRLTAGTTTVQTKLRVGPADDPFERDADAVAEQVMHRLGRGAARADVRAAGGVAQRVTTLDAVGAEGGELGAEEDRAIRDARGRGRPLDPGTRTQMEAAFGADFGRVRLHTDAGADRLGRALSADAFTTGSDIFFRSGVYRPRTDTGTKVLAHELAHTVQQGAARPPTVQRLFGANTKKRIKANAYPAIEATLARAQQGVAPEEEIVKALKEVERHRKAASKMKGKDLTEQMDTLRYLGDDLGIALDRIHMAATRQQAKDIYLSEAQTGGLKALSGPAKSEYRPDRNQRAAGVAAGMGRGESAAITAYTADDYKYINPAAAYSKSWMQTQMSDDANQTGTEKERFEEGGLHAGMMMEALAKLPVWQGEGFRGERLTPDEFAQKFDEKGDTVTAKQKTEVKAAFSSVSIKRSVAEGFANGPAKKPEKTVSVLYLIDVHDARDVRAFSLVKSEDEVLCPAGSKFQVTKVEKHKTGEPGKPPATAWYTVHMQQG